MKVKIALALVLAYTACAGSPAPEVRPSLLIVSDATFPPFHYVDDDGAPTGYDIELARRLVEHAGFEPVVAVRDYDALLAGLPTGEHDVIAATTGITPERQEHYLFTEPYYVTCHAALVRVGVGEPASLAELAGKRVGASGSGSAARAMGTLTGAEHVSLEDGRGISPLDDGTVDAIIVDEWHAVEMARASNGTVRVLSEPVVSEHYAFVLAPGREELKAALDDALTAMRENGEVDALRERFGVARDAEWPVNIAETGSTPASVVTPVVTPVVTRGAAQTSGSCALTIDCQGGGNIRETLCGEITADDGSVWPVPAQISNEGALVDVFNECTGGGANPDFANELETQIIDDDGVDITAHLFGDNYFELYANGVYVGRDAVGFTPFNSHAARFRVSYPVTYALLLVDWEGYLGVGLEDMSEGLHIGDGGFIATFSDGASTDASWKCKAFYIAPVDDPSCVAFDAYGNPDSSGCASEDAAVSCITDDPMSTCGALHLPSPDGWMRPELDDTHWTPASTYTADDVTRSPGFRNYEETLFRGGQFIWTSNLDLDNRVICRKTVDSPR